MEGIKVLGTPWFGASSRGVGGVVSSGLYMSEAMKYLRLGPSTSRIPEPHPDSDSPYSYPHTPIPHIPTYTPNRTHTTITIGNTAPSYEYRSQTIAVGFASLGD
ncbi:hypothetical protein D9758_017908 [Tetrapyrgos nigripes]|uniref:Uncharacterized protein n=1 Tax=Tetrapyrgos nigripes TaxID=182062 RepID=A0A8H5C1Z8_9AGAR|nr:hypothetical protein D9758_017908 [Tetrapyrgos nigripes]